MIILASNYCPVSFLDNPKFTQFQRENQVDFKNKPYFEQIIECNSDAFLYINYNFSFF